MREDCLGSRAGDNRVIWKACQEQSGSRLSVDLGGCQTMLFDSSAGQLTGNSRLVFALCQDFGGLNGVVFAHGSEAVINVSTAQSDSRGGSRPARPCNANSRGDSMGTGSFV